jgi:ribosomal protein L37AE/L43A
MPRDPPMCPKCDVKMRKIQNGLYECPKCGGTYIPGDVMGVFVPCSVIGIHSKAPA